MHENIKKVLHDAGCDVIFSVEGDEGIQRTLREESDAELKAYIQFDTFAIPLYVSKNFKVAYSRHIPVTFSAIGGTPNHNYFSGNILFGEEIYNVLSPEEVLILAIVNVPKIVFPGLFFNGGGFNNTFLINFAAGISGNTNFMNAYRTAYSEFSKYIESLSEDVKEEVLDRNNMTTPDYVQGVIDSCVIRFNIDRTIPPRIFIVDAEEDKVLKCVNMYNDIDFENGFKEIYPRKRDEDDEDCCCSEEKEFIDMPCYYDVDRGDDYEVDFPGDGDDYHEDDDGEYIPEEDEYVVKEAEETPYVIDETSGKW